MKALVLSGGGAKGGYQVGVLKRWVEESADPYEPSIIIGTSIGNLNGGFVAQAPAGEFRHWVAKLEQLWLGIDTPDVYKKWFFCEAAALWKWSVYNSQGARDIIDANIDPEALRGSGRKFRSVYVSWRTGEILVGTEQDDDIRDKMYASASFPVFFEPAVVGDELCTDGGLRDIAPIGLALEIGAKEIDVVLCSNPENSDDWHSDLPGVLPYALRCVDIMSTEILLNDVKMCLLKNKLPEYDYVDLRVVEPTRPLGDSFDFSPTESKRRIEIGYEDACDL